MSKELKPCPFCGGDAERFTIEDEGDNFGGDVIQCMGICGASSHVEFGRKENLASLWNTRTSRLPDREEVARVIEPRQFAMLDEQRKAFPADPPERFLEHPAIKAALAKADRIISLMEGRG